MGRVLGLGIERACQGSFDWGNVGDPSDARSRFGGQTIETGVGEPAAPFPNGRERDPKTGRDGRVGLSGRCGHDDPARIAELVGVAGSRRAIGECFERAEGHYGPDDCEVRSWAGWHRHVTLSLFALAVVAAIRARPAPAAGANKSGRARAGECAGGAEAVAHAGAGGLAGRGVGAGVVGVAAGSAAPGAGLPRPRAGGEAADDSLRLEDEPTTSVLGALLPAHRAARSPTVAARTGERPAYFFAFFSNSSAVLRSASALALFPACVWTFDRARYRSVVFIPNDSALSRSAMALA